VKVWEFKNASANDVATLVFASDKDLDSGMFDAEGAALSWLKSPRVEVFIEPRAKKAKPRVDISPLTPGALVLNDKAKAALGPFLSRFGQLLALQCADGPEYFYNVTNVVDCIDLANSKTRASGSIAKEAFFEDKVPDEPTVFKDPRTAATRVYVNEAAKNILEGLIAGAGITGAAFAEPGAVTFRPRPTA
jgi:hypothetical protein